MNYIDSGNTYVTSATDALTKIQRIDVIINTLLGDVMNEVLATGHINQYELNDQQTVVKCNYRTADQIMKDVYAFESMKNYYARQVNGGISILVDRRALNNYRIQ